MSSDQIIGLLAGGLSAAVLTAAFNVWWDTQRQEIAEKWERRKYEATGRLKAVSDLTEVFYAMESELHFVILEVEGAQEGLRAVEQQVSQALQSQSPGLTVEQLKPYHYAALDPVRQWADRMQERCWNQYNNSVKGLRARAEAAVSIAEQILPTQGLQGRVATLFQQLFANLAPPGLAGAKARLELLRGREQEFRDILRQIRGEARAALDQS